MPQSVKQPATAADKAARREENLRAALRNFDSLPDAAAYRIQPAVVISGESRAAFYAGSKANRRPPIFKLAGGRASGVQVGELRRFLADRANYRAPQV